MRGLYHLEPGIQIKSRVIMERLMSVIRNLIITLLCVMPAVSIAAQATSCGEQIVNGDTAYKKFDNKSALIAYKQAQQICPKSFELAMKITRAHIDMGEDSRHQGWGSEVEHFNVAAKLARNLVANYPDEVESYLYLATAHGNLAMVSEPDMMIKSTREFVKNNLLAIEMNPKNAAPYALLGIYYQRTANANWFLKSLAKLFWGDFPDGDNHDAERYLLKAQELYPQINQHTTFNKQTAATSYRITWELIYVYRSLGNDRKRLGLLEEIKSIPFSDHEDPPRAKTLASW
jgi:tetratricopeptide (TPR) repeat protein